MAMPAFCLPVKEKSPKSYNDDGKYGPVSPAGLALTHSTTVMSSAQFAAGHVFYNTYLFNAFPWLFSCFYYNNTFILTIKTSFVQYIHI